MALPEAVLIRTRGPNPSESKRKSEGMIRVPAAAVKNINNAMAGCRRQDARM